MSRAGRNNTRTGRASSTSKYDAHNNVLSQTYGALADLRRELADPKSRVAEREELLRIFASCRDSQRAWLLLEDYFEKLSLTRKDFPGQQWWPRMLTSEGRNRLEEVALLFLRANRSLPSELQPYANLTRFAEIEQAEEEERILRRLEEWLCPATPAHLDSPRAALRVLCAVEAAPEHPALHALSVRFNLFRPRTGDKTRPISELIDLTHRAAHEQELFPPDHWDFITWLADTYNGRAHDRDHLLLAGLELLQWLAKWGRDGRLELLSTLNPDRGQLVPGGPQPSTGKDASARGGTLAVAPRPSTLDSLSGGSGLSTLKHAPTLTFLGQVLSLAPHLENGKSELSFTHKIKLPDGEERPLSEARFFAGDPPLALVGSTFFLLRQAPPPELLEFWAKTPAVPVQKLSHRLRTYLRKAHAEDGIEWEQLCITHTAVPQFIFELNDDTVQLRLLARSDRDQSMWHWTGQEWQRDGLPAPQWQCAGTSAPSSRSDKPEVLEDARLDAAVAWLRRLDWFTPEPGLWVGDANEAFLATLAHAWPDKPNEADYLGNPAFQRLFLSPRQLRPRLLVKGSGIDWFAVSAEWEAEGLKLSVADLERLATATGRFVKLPDAGWLELDTKAVAEAHEAIADLGLDALSAMPQQVGLEQGAVLNESSFARFADSPEAKELRQKLAGFEGIPVIDLPTEVKAEVRPYQREGFNFLCHLTEMRLGGILADDMGLGKTLQTLSWLAWLHKRNGARHAPALVICPASVLHNWRREAEKFTPHLKVLVLESGAARHTLRKQIPQHDLIVTNYALLRRDWEALQKFDFCAVILDEAQFIKNPTAQVTQSVKQLKAHQRLALTGTPLENRLLDLWSITDFVQPVYLGTQDHFVQTYEPRGEGEEAITARRIARRRLSAKLRPLMLRRLKRQVAQDLPERIEMRRDCDLGEPQRKLYLAELRRSRELS